MSADSSVIVIEELPSPGFAGTRLELRGGGLPKIGAAWGGKHTVITRYYSGNPVATQQAIGPQEVPSSWEGVWRRNILEVSPATWTDENGISTSVVQPITLMQLLDDIRFRGYPLRVTWATALKEIQTTGDSDVQIIREGRLTDINFPVDRAEDIAWKATFTWYSRGQPAQQRTSLRNASSTDSLAGLTISVQEALVRAQALKNKINPLSQYGAASNFSLSDLDKLATYPQSLMDDLNNQFNVVLSRISDVSDAVNDALVTPAEVASKALSMANSALAVCNQFMLNMGELPSEYVSTSGDAADVARNAKYLADTADSMWTVIEQVLDIVQQAAKAKASQSALDGQGARVGDGSGSQDAVIYKVKRGDTPISISLFFYQSPDYGGAILQANRLPPYTINLDVGSILVIPTNPLTV